MGFKPEDIERFKGSLLKHQRRELARQRKAEGREYMSIIFKDVLSAIMPKNITS